MTYHNMSDDTPTEKQLRANPGIQYIEYNSLIWFEDGMFHLASALHLSYVGEWQKKAESSFETYEELLANINQHEIDVEGAVVAPTTKDFPERKSMTKYNVLEIYTPHDPLSDRSRQTHEFESNIADLMELALLARSACYDHPVSEDTKICIQHRLRESDVMGQLAHQEASEFRFSIFGRNGDWDLLVSVAC